MKNLSSGPGAAWNRFFHGEIHPRKLQFLQIGFGCLILIYFANLAPHWNRWFSEEGVLDSASARANLDPEAFSILFWFPESQIALWLPLCLGIASSIGLIFGWMPRIAALVIFLSLVTLHHRNNLIWDGEDVLFRLTAFLLVFAGKSPRDGFIPAWPIRLIQLELSLVYLSAALRKLEGKAWQEGSAVYYALHLDDFAGPLLLPGPIRESLFFSQAASWSTIAIELVLSVAFWFSSTRSAAIKIGIAFHLVMILLFNLFLFHWLIILLLLTHADPYPPTLIASWKRWGGNLRKTPPNPASQGNVGTVEP